MANKSAYDHVLPTITWQESRVALPASHAHTTRYAYTPCLPDLPAVLRIRQAATSLHRNMGIPNSKKSPTGYIFALKITPSR